MPSWNVSNLGSHDILGLNNCTFPIALTFYGDTILSYADIENGNSYSVSYFPKAKVYIESLPVNDKP